MAVTMDDVLAQLDSEEPDYEQAARLGPDALPHLLHLINDDDPMRASKAVYLAARIDDEQSKHALDNASHHADPIVRVAVAGAIRYLSKDSHDLLLRLLDDNDSGVRRVVLRSIGELRPAGLNVTIQHVAQNDPNESLRTLAATTLQRLP